MSEFNLHVSVTHLSQVDRHQDEAHKTPIVHQEQNAQKTEEELLQRLAMPVAPDEVENKNINPEDHRTVADNKKRRRQRQRKKKKAPRKLNERGSSDHFVDVTV